MVLDLIQNCILVDIIFTLSIILIASDIFEFQWSNLLRSVVVLLFLEGVKYSATESQGRVPLDIL